MAVSLHRVSPDRGGDRPQRSLPVTIVDGPFDLNLFPNREVDAASAMTYNREGVAVTGRASSRPLRR